MSFPKSVIIAFPKGLSNPKTNQVNELTCDTLTRFTASILTNKTRMDARKIYYVSPKREETRCSDDDFAIKLIKTTDSYTRSKKRRLDHLTCEEKQQRKKLKNRVAAQTSRDRKKAKMDELEETVKKLRDKNEQLEQECTMLRSQNESLSSETKRLRKERDMRNANVDQQQQYCSACQTRVGCAASQLGSAVSPDYPLPQDPDPLPSLEELFSDCQNEEGYVEQLEELAASLMREVTSGMETNPHRTDEQICVAERLVEKPDSKETMVGQTSEDVEADRIRESVSNVSYLPETSDWRNVVCDTKNTALIKTEIEIKEESESNLDTVYGTYDEVTNSITIKYPGDESDDCVGIQESVQEVASTENGDCDPGLAIPPLTTHLGHLAQFSPTYTNTMSPGSDVHSDADSCGISSSKLDYACLSDGGYESHDSPDSRFANNALADPWHDSFTELFPMLA